MICQAEIGVHLAICHDGMHAFVLSRLPAQDKGCVCDHHKRVRQRRARVDKALALEELTPRRCCLPLPRP